MYEGDVSSVTTDVSIAIDDLDPLTLGISNFPI